MFDEIDLNDIGQYLPAYLTASQKKELTEGLKDFPESFQYYSNVNDYNDQILQGDIWKDFIVVDYHTGAKDKATGIILSNSCDISPDNSRDSEVFVNFATAIKLSDFRDLVSKLKSEEAAANYVNSARSQKLTSLLFMPRVSSNFPDCVFDLRRIHSMPVSDLRSNGKKIATLSQQGFYMFILKLSLHFNRLFEGVHRNSPATIV